MIEKLIVEAPLNPLSLGNVSYNILYSLYKKGVKVLYVPIGQPDVGVYKNDDQFKNWLQEAGNKFFSEFKRDIPSLKIWHINQSWQFPSDKRYLATFHECDTATSEELNIVKNTNKTFFCGTYSPSVFNDLGAKTDSYNLGFDSASFYPTNKKYFADGRIQWFLGGKAELRKNTWQIINLWAKKYGKKQGESYKSGEQMHFLNLCIFNNFYDPKIQEQQINQALEGQKYCNIQLFPFLDRESFNDILNASDFDLTGLSSAESWNLPAFNMTCLGKWSIVLNATGHKSWANESNSILVQPNGKRTSVDNMFFQSNSIFNRGQFYTFDPDEAVAAMETAVSKHHNKINEEGIKLGAEMTYEKTVDHLLNKIENG
jgi:hypothetical protein